MSALGQKQTFAVQNAMSALLPKADMCGAKRDVRFVPGADSCTATNPVQSHHRQAQAAKGLAAQIGGHSSRRRTAGMLAHAAHPGSARPRRGSRTVNSVKSPTSLS